MKRRIRGVALLSGAAMLTFLQLVPDAMARALQTPAWPAKAEAAPAQAGNRAAAVPDEVELNGKVVCKRVPPRLGDICLLCNHPVDKDDVVFLARGHRLPLHLEELDANVGAQLEGLLAQFEPRGAFLGAEPAQPALSRAWFFAGMYILAGLVFAALCAHRALHMGRSPAAWFGIGLALNAFGYLLLLTRARREIQAPAGLPGGLGKIAATHQPEPCPACGTLNHPSAAACLGCGGGLEPKTVSEVARAGLRPA